MSDPPAVRLSDEERERAAAEIREHFTAGRLDADELAERLEGVFGARTAGDLQALRADLPRLPATPAQQQAELGARRTQLRRELVQQTGGTFVAFLVCTVIWFVTGRHGSFWPAWVGLFALIAVLRNGWRLYGPAPELDRVEAELRARRQRRGRRFP
jgi:hypothetical protein